MSKRAKLRGREKGRKNENNNLSLFLPLSAFSPCQICLFRSPIIIIIMSALLAIISYAIKQVFHLFMNII